MSHSGRGTVNVTNGDELTARLLVATFLLAFRAVLVHCRYEAVVLFADSPSRPGRSGQ